MSEETIVLVHPSSHYDYSRACEEGIKTLVKGVESSRIISLYSGEENRDTSYVQGDGILSKRGEFEKDQFNLECHIVVGGGYYWQCHKRAIIGLLEKFKISKLSIPLEATYVDPWLEDDKPRFWGLPFERDSSLNKRETYKANMKTRITMSLAELVDLCTKDHITTINEIARVYQGVCGMWNGEYDKEKNRINWSYPI